ncbi:MAG: magnesium transporter [alpha proteobacterium HIMB114]|nr:MAG: magnesium transporter [alpha proteobacterium HIMB114]
MSIEQTIGNKTFEVTKELIDSLTILIDEKKVGEINIALNALHPSDAAELLSNLTEQSRYDLFLLETIELKADTIVELNNTLQKEILNKLPANAVANILNELESDNVLKIVSNLNKEKKLEVYEKIPLKEKQLIEEVLNIYPQDSAARLMQTEYCAVSPNWTVGETIDYLRENEDLPKEFLQIFIVDNFGKLIGSIPSSRVLRNPRNIKMDNIMDRRPVLINGDLDKEEVGNLFEQYNLVSAGVIDRNKKLIGMITADDILTVVKEEGEEDVLKLAGVQDEEVTDNAFKITKKRFIWLLINLFTAVIASRVIGLFDENIEKVVALAVLMPIVASMGGNAATQTLAVTIRLLATKELTTDNLFKIINKEFCIGFLNGLFFSIISALFVFFWFYDFKLSILIGISMIINMIFAGLSGIIIPVMLEKYKIDPAIASTVFVTTITDVIGFLSFLGLASFVLGI